MKPLIGYGIATPGEHPTGRGQLYDYIMAGNGVFLHAEREYMRALVPVSGPCLVRGLETVQPYFHLEVPPVPQAAMAKMLEVARASRQGTQPVECLFHLWWEGSAWHLTIPRQERGPGHVKPLDTGEGSSYERALIEVHSHHSMAGFWSGTDDKDEQGFRLYGVLGHIFTKPELRLRIGVYGQFMELDAEEVFEMPSGVMWRAA